AQATTKSSDPDQILYIRNGEPSTEFGKGKCGGKALSVLIRPPTFPAFQAPTMRPGIIARRRLGLKSDNRCRARSGSGDHDPSPQATHANDGYAHRSYALRQRHGHPILGRATACVNAHAPDAPSENAADGTRSA